MPTQDEAYAHMEEKIVRILRRELLLVARPDYEETETWMVKDGNIEHCAKLIVSSLFG